MKLTPVDITNKEFRKMLRGYDPEEVDEFLDQIVEDYEELFKENSLLKEKINAMNEKIEHYSKIESTIQNTLLLAQNAAEQAKVSSQKEADIVIKHANDSAKKILDKAHTDVVSITQEYDRLKQEFVKFRAKFRNFITVQMETFEDLEKDFIKNYNLNQTSDFDKIKSQESRENNDFELNSEVSENFEKDSFVDVQPFESDDKTSSRFKSSEEVDSDLENIKKFFVSET
ncbi:DivIVA domain-containing protein [Candidatus Arthromitus sp. SFB-turkey]|uniref:DivIVA domain-containing protein n=1 Tax=Candidatus Arthromitus sp. SFB-turkey TaxID=1840217 RepID=UPI0009EE85A7|nr:DivIVA domain-containing protein [Candidatus Arthromitus sp. SFB-turkey]